MCLLVNAHVTALDPGRNLIIAAGYGTGEADDGIVAKLDRLAGHGAQAAIIRNGDLRPTGVKNAVLGVTIVTQINCLYILTVGQSRTRHIAAIGRTTAVGTPISNNLGAGTAAIGNNPTVVTKTESA